MSTAASPSNAERFLVTALREEAARRGIACTTYSANWIVRLSRGDQRATVMGYHFPLNSAPATMLAGDKAAASEAMAEASVPCVEHRLFLRPALAGYVGSVGNWAAMLAYAQEHGEHLVVKPNEGTGGQQVLRTGSVLELETAVHELFAHHRALALSPFHAIDREVRLVMLDGTCWLAYEKVRTAIDTEWRHNLGLGATPQVLDPPPDALVEHACAAMQALGLRFASVDLVEVSGTWRVLEVNAGVMMEAFARQSKANAARASAIYGAALDAVFGDSKHGTA
ncbi:MAG: RimK-like protein [Bacteroidota bacterium]